MFLLAEKLWPVCLSWGKFLHMYFLQIVLSSVLHSNAWKGSSPKSAVIY